MVSIAGVAIYVSYGLPVLFRVTLARNTFIPGPFRMSKRVSLVVGWVAVLWVTILTVLFCLPVAYPIDSQTLNYAPVVLGALLLLVLGVWALYARKWFKGPIRTIDKLENGPHPSTLKL